MSENRWPAHPLEEWKQTCDTLHLWNRGTYTDTVVTAFAGINYLKNDDPAWSWTPQFNAGSFHPGGANFAFADGSVRFLSESTGLWTLAALTTRAGREAIPDE